MVTWTAAIQHAFTNNLSLNVAYVGTHATGLPEYVNVNQPRPGQSSAADPVGFQQRRPYYNQFPYFSDVLVYSNVGYSNYHGLQLNLVQTELPWSGGFGSLYSRLTPIPRRAARATTSRS